jgi:hypothetical protein
VKGAAHVIKQCLGETVSTQQLAETEYCICSDKMVFQYRVKGSTGSQKALALNTVIKITHHRGLPAADGCWSKAFFQPLVNVQPASCCYRGGVSAEASNLSSDTQEYSLHQSSSCTSGQSQCSAIFAVYYAKKSFSPLIVFNSACLTCWVRNAHCHFQKSTSMSIFVQFSNYSFRKSVKTSNFMAGRVWFV